MKQKPAKLNKMVMTPFYPGGSPGVLHPALKKYFGYCLTKAAIRVKAKFDERFEKHGIIGPQLGMLVIVKEEGAITQNELGKYMAIDKATMVRLLDQLEDRKFLTRTQSREDRRANHLQITKAGEQIIAKLDQERKECEAEILEPLTKTERDQLFLLLEKLLSSIPVK